MEYPSSSSSCQEIISSDNVDAIVIGTGPYLHCEASCAGLKSSKHVLCEASMAMNRAEARQMFVASESSCHRIAQLVPAPFTLRADKTIRTYIKQGHR
ncbi:MAG: Gfo/Idh/MocA family oxidoreductase [Nitrospinaceae bacterium]|nr:Gfo/Idh/MocA family oxidoreductase [Nitrospinaceae bacterium]